MSEQQFQSLDSHPRGHNNDESCCLSLQDNSSTNSHRRRSLLLTLSTRLHAASVSGSADHYTEKLLDTNTDMKKKNKRIAGIDQDELLDPTLLADPDSCFCEFKGVHIHYKIQDPDPQQITNPLLQKLGFPMILLHGFGASTYSWSRAMKPLAHLVGNKVVAFDRPAFGLTSRVFLDHTSPSSSDTKPFNPYSMSFSVLATLQFIGFLSTEKAVLVGYVTFILLHFV